MNVALDLAGMGDAFRLHMRPFVVLPIAMPAIY
jgi:hypothetical protein